MCKMRKDNVKVYALSATITCLWAKLEVLYEITTSLNKFKKKLQVCFCQIAHH